MASKGAPKTSFPFDVKKPIKCGTFKKSGKGNKGFKTRFFALYKGYLVYYDAVEKWQFDCTVGDTLGGRLGAIRLKGGRTSIPPEGGVDKNVPFPFVVYSPDKTNKRDYFLMDCASDEERQSWVEAINGAFPKVAAKS